jgi:hypothetical protein
MAGDALCAKVTNPDRAPARQANSATRAAHVKPCAIREALVGRFVEARAAEVLGQMAIACRRWNLAPNMGDARAAAYGFPPLHDLRECFSAPRVGPAKTNLTGGKSAG